MAIGGVPCGLSELVASAAEAEDLDQLAACLPALGRTLGARVAFLARVPDDGGVPVALGGEDRVAFHHYVRRVFPTDPLGEIARRAREPVAILSDHVGLLGRDADLSAIRKSAEFRVFHARHGFQHHLLLRLSGRHVLAPGAVAVGLTRSGRDDAFDRDDVSIATIALSALGGAARRILSRRPAGTAEADAGAWSRLTEAEREVLELLALGLSNREIAERRGVSLETVKTHLHRTYRKLGVRTRAETLARFLRTG